MENFFLNQNNGINFNFLSITHLIILIITFSILTVIINNKNNIKAMDYRYQKKIRIIFGFVLLVAFLLRRGSFVLYGVYSWKYHLDIGFCNMINLLFIIYCFTGSKKVYNICYYGAFCGPLLSIIMPSIEVGINNYSFYNFILIHNITFLMNIIFSIFENKEYSKKDFWGAIIILISYLVSSYIFNWIFTTSYNRLSNFLTLSILKYRVVRTICDIQILNIIILIGIGRIMFEVAKYTLNLLNGGYHEKK